MLCNHNLFIPGIYQQNQFHMYGMVYRRYIFKYYNPFTISISLKNPYFIKRVRSEDNKSIPGLQYIFP